MATKSDSDTETTENDEYYKLTRIADEIHDYIEIPHEIRRIIDTPEFQRLRELKQLGASYYIFPGATHCRFEHSIGVFYLARRLILHLRDHQPELHITKKEIYCVSAAGLLHDLGHGPFSHTFDFQFVPSMTNCKFRHEDMSIKLIQKLYRDNNIEIDEKSLQLICALVSPSTHPQTVDEYKQLHRGFLFQIIANETNGIDVDKWDYFLRDSHNLSLDISFKYTRLLTHCRVINDRICFHDKTAYDVQILFNTRYDLFKRVYSHKTSKAVEYMLCDIMRFANGYLRITDKIQNAADFMELTDNIIARIQWAPITVHHNAVDRDINEGLKKAQKLIRRLQTRDIYKCVGYVLLDSSIVAQHYKHYMLMQPKQNSKWSADHEDDKSETEDVKNDGYEQYTKYDLKLIEKQWQSELYEFLKQETNDFAKYEYKLKADEIVCHLMSLSYGFNDKHPIDKVYFYNAKSLNTSHSADLDQISQLYDVNRFKEVIFRSYVKHKQYAKECEQVFKKFCALKKLISANQMSRNFSLGLSPKTARSPSPSDAVAKHNKLEM